VILNGGLRSLDEAESHLKHVDGVMFGRAAYQNPSVLMEVDRRLFGAASPNATRRDAVDRMRPQIARELARGTPLHHLTRPMLGLFQGVAGARRWRRVLTGEARRPGAGLEVIDDALAGLGAKVHCDAA
jgi:tRNA-dihydrouridine synthase A